MHKPVGTEALKDLYEESMRRLPRGLVLVISKVSGRPWGLTVSSCTAVSAEPPTIALSIGSSTATAESIRQEGRFSVAILDYDLLDLAEFGSARGAAKFIDAWCEDTDSPFPRVRDCTAQLHCELTTCQVVGDHTMFFGQVLDGAGAAGAPDLALVYYRETLARLDASPLSALRSESEGARHGAA